MSIFDIIREMGCPPGMWWNDETRQVEVSPVTKVLRELARQKADEIARPLDPNRNYLSGTQ